MGTVNANIKAVLEKLLTTTVSDFAGFGLIDPKNRKLNWQQTVGGVSKRTLMIEQNMRTGLSGLALRAGRPAKTEPYMNDSQRFRLGEPLLSVEQLRVAAAIPVSSHSTIVGIILLGRRTSDQALSVYSDNDLSSARQLTLTLADVCYNELETHG